MGIQERKNRQRQVLRQEILDAAREMFVHEGYEGVTMRKIADRIEYSPTTIYYYFQDKSQLLSEIVSETFSKLNQELEAVLGTEGQCPKDCLWRGMRTYVDFALANPSHYYLTFMFRQATSCPSPLDDEVHLLGMKAFDYLRQAVKRAMDAGEIAPQDLETASQTMWAGIHGVSSLLISLEGGFPFVDHQQLVDSVLRTLLRGAGMKFNSLQQGEILPVS